MGSESLRNGAYGAGSDQLVWSSGSLEVARYRIVHTGWPLKGQGGLFLIIVKATL